MTIVRTQLHNGPQQWRNERTAHIKFSVTKPRLPSFYLNRWFRWRRFFQPNDSYIYTYIRHGNRSSIGRKSHTSDFEWNGAAVKVNRWDAMQHKRTHRHCTRSHCMSDNNERQTRTHKLYTDYLCSLDVSRPRLRAAGYVCQYIYIYISVVKPMYVCVCVCVFGLQTLNTATKHKLFQSTWQCITNSSLLEPRMRSHYVKENRQPLPLCVQWMLIDDRTDTTHWIVCPM